MPRTLTRAIRNVNLDNQATYRYTARVIGNSRILYGETVGQYRNFLKEGIASTRSSMRFFISLSKRIPKIRGLCYDIVEIEQGKIAEYLDALIRLEKVKWLRGFEDGEKVRG